MPALSPWAAALCKPSGWWPPYVWRVKGDILQAHYQQPYVWRVKGDILQAHYHIIAIITVQWENRRRLSITIGAYRAVWVPGQDLATLHLMRNCGKHILSLHCMLYIRSARICYMLVTMCLHIQSSWYEYEITWACRHLCLLPSMRPDCIFVFSLFPDDN